MRETSDKIREASDDIREDAVIKYVKLVMMLLARSTVRQRILTVGFICESSGGNLFSIYPS